jgi:hypothetical protein
MLFFLFQVFVLRSRFDLPVLTGYGLKLDGLNVFYLMDEVEWGLGEDGFI